MRIVHIFLHSSNFSTDGKNCFRVLKGCPQGGLISHLLFTIFFGSLLEQLNDKIVLECIGAFADDLIVQASGEQELQELVNMIQQWAIDNNCKLNTDKTMIVQIKKTAHNYPQGQ